MDPATLEILKLLTAGLIGTLSALLASYFSAREAARRHALELRQRQQELWAQFLSPIATRRLEAHETCYDLIQQAIETKAVNTNDYLSLRRASIYLRPELRESLFSSLRRLLAADPEDMNDILRDLRRLKTEMEDVLGLRIVDNMLRDQFYQQVSQGE